MKLWRDEPTEENFWGMVVSYAGVGFKTYSGLPFSYEIKKGRNGEYTKELWIDRREKSKSLAWSSVLLALAVVPCAEEESAYLFCHRRYLKLLYVKLCVSLWQLNLRKQSWLIFFNYNFGWT